jgi:hypothetical protein
MDRGDMDERLREVYESNAPVVDELAFAARLRRRSSERQMLPAPRPRMRHMWLAAASSVIAVAALIVGTYEAVVHIGGERAIVLITDDTMSPAGTGSTEHRPGANSPDGVDVNVPVAEDVLQTGFLDLWERLATAAGIEGGDARLESFRLSFDYPSRDLATFDLQTTTRDGYQLRVSYSESAGSLRMYGTRLPEFTPYLTPSFPAVDALLSALDLVGMKSLLARLDPAESAGTETSIGDDVTGVEMHLADRSDRGTVEIGAQARAYYHEAGDWVQLGPDDRRRTAEKTDVVLVVRQTREDPAAIFPGDYASFIIPAADLGGKITTSEAASTTSQPTLSSETLPSPYVRIGVMIPFCMLYQGRPYTCTDQQVETTNDTPAHVYILGSGLSALDEKGVADPSSPQYEIYAIRGTDQEEAIAVKFQGVGSSGPIWVWLKYESVK